MSLYCKLKLETDLSTRYLSGDGLVGRATSESDTDVPLSNVFTKNKKSTPGQFGVHIEL